LESRDETKSPSPATTSARSSSLSSIPNGRNTGPNRFQLYILAIGDPPDLNVSIGAGGMPRWAPRFEINAPNP
jgi:hypothetical protein